MNSVRDRQVARIVLGWALLATCVAWVTPVLAATPPDAIIEVWEQEWRQQADGTTVYYEKQHVRLNNDRTFRGDFVDPRITYNVATDKLEILNARVLRPDGTYRELPDYSHVQAAPPASAGWPAFADIQEHVIVMSGIEPGCLVELEYRITSAPGAKPALAADVRLDHEYPVLQRCVRVASANDALLQLVLSGLPEEQLRAAFKGTPRVEIVVTDNGPTPLARAVVGPVESVDWRFANLPARPHEPQSPPWQTGAARLVFSNAGPADAWLRRTLDELEAAAKASPLVTRLVAEWTKDAQRPSDSLRAIQEQLAGSFNFVDFPEEWRPAKPRPAADVLRDGHGLPEEAAAVLLALARAAGLPARPAVLVSDDTWAETAPQRSLVAAYVVLLDGDAGPEIWEARRGRITRDRRWAGHTLLTSADGSLARHPWAAWHDADESRCDVVGRVTINADGGFSGTLSLRTSGLFAAPETLRTTADQKRRVTALVHRLLPDAQVESFNVTALAEGEFNVDVTIKSAKALEQRAGARWLTLGEHGPATLDVPLPLASTLRRTPARLTGAFDEQISLTIEWPKGWRVTTHPLSSSPVSAHWGQVTQQVTVADGQLTLLRQVRVHAHELSASALTEMYHPINRLRADSARTLVLMP